MKNSPEPEWFHKLEERLGRYIEQPDADVFDKIVAGIGNQDEPMWLAWAHRSAVAVCVMLFLWSGINGIDASRELTVTPLAQIEPPSENEGSSIQATEDSTDAQRSIRQPETHYDEAFSRREDSEQIIQSQDKIDSDDADALATESIKTTSADLVSDLGSANADNRSEIIETDSSTSVLGSQVPERKGTIIPDRKKRGFTLYASISPSLSFQKITPLPGDGLVVDRFSASPVFSQGRLGVSLQVGIQSTIANRLEVYGGFTLYRQAQVLVYHYQSGEHGQHKQLETFEYALIPGTTERRVRYNMINLGADAGLMYYLRGDRLAHKMGAGLSFQHGLKKISEGETYDNAKSQYFSYQLFYRNEYAASKSIRIFVQPFYRHTFISNEALEEPFTIKPSHAGLRFGVLYNRR